MPRQGRRFRDDDEDDYDRPRRRRAESGAVVAAAAVGGLLLLGLIGGGLALFTRREAAREEAMLRAEMEAEAARAEAMAAQARADRRPPPPADPDGLPPPNPAPPAAEPVTKPPASKWDRPGDADRWLVLFRAQDPAAWNTSTSRPEAFAVPLRSAPPGLRFLRLRRMDTGATIIIPMTRDRLASTDPPGPGARWSGEAKNEHGGYHLGLADGPAAKWQEGKGTIGVLMDGWDAVSGSGFGHAHHVDDGGQRYAWQGKEIAPTAFEIAVTTGELAEDERKLLK